MTELGVQTVSDSSVMSIEQSRAIQEVQASLVIAKKFPRDQDAAYLRIMKACERYSLADQAEYAYPRGDKTVTGPTIRLAEVLAQNWGNLNFGVRELSQSEGESEVESFAWDLETNIKKTKTFTVKHKRYTKKKGNVNLTDPRDIYELAANQGARRERACILGVIPGDIVEAAQTKCRETLKRGIKEKPIKDQIRATLKAFDSLGITKDLIETRLGHGTNTIIEDELIELNNIGRSIKDNMTSREEWFDIKGESQQKAADLTKRVKEQATEIPEAPGDPAQDLKQRMDEGDKGIVGYKEGLKPETETPLLLPAGVDPFVWLMTCKPRSSVSNAKLIIDVYDANEAAILKDIDAQSKLKIQGKRLSATTFLEEIEGRKQEMAEEEPPPPDEPPFEPDQKEESAVNGRLKFLAAMKEYKNLNSDIYAGVLIDNEWDSMNAVPPGDEKVALGFMGQAFEV